MLEHQVVGVSNFEDLFAWQCAAALRDRVVALCATTPLQDDRRFRDQFRGAACAAPRLIAEGFGRYGHREFRRYLSMARAELLEVKNDLTDLQARGLVPPDTVEELRQLTERALRITTRLRSSVGGD